MYNHLTKELGRSTLTTKSNWAIYIKHLFSPKLLFCSPKTKNSQEIICPTAKNVESH